MRVNSFDQACLVYLLHQRAGGKDSKVRFSEQVRPSFFKVSALMAFSLATVCAWLGTVLASDALRFAYSTIVAAVDRTSAFKSLASMELHLASLKSDYIQFVAQQSMVGRPLAAAEESTKTGEWEIALTWRPDGLKQWIFDRRSIQEACDQANMLKDRIEWTTRKVEQLRGNLVADRDLGSTWQPVLRYGVELFMHLPFALYLYVVAIRFFSRGVLLAGALRPVALK